MSIQSESGKFINGKAKVEETKKFWGLRILHLLKLFLLTRTQKRRKREREKNELTLKAWMNGGDGSVSLTITSKGSASAWDTVRASSFLLGYVEQYLGCPY